MTATRSIRRARRRSVCAPTGFTLLETLVALAVFTMVVVPLMTGVSLHNQTRATRESIVATCLLQQEEQRIRAFPQYIDPVRYRVVGSKTWVVHAETAGSRLVWCTLSVEKDGHQCGKVGFYVYRQ
jgi:prepilin-type N-terminal cleavage/methylation domain-containing protein